MAVCDPQQESYLPKCFFNSSFSQYLNQQSEVRANWEQIKLSKNSPTQSWFAHGNEICLSENILELVLE